MQESASELCNAFLCARGGVNAGMRVTDVFFLCRLSRARNFSSSFATKEEEKKKEREEKREEEEKEKGG